jgi:sugar lactone lactonase YvrE
MPESPRWHDDRLWFSNWGTKQIVVIDLEGNNDVLQKAPMDSGGRRTGSRTDGC